MRKSLPTVFGFYAILTDPVKGYDYMTSLLVDNGMPVVQLRMKDVPQKQVVETAARMRKITEGTATRLIINDSPGIAAAVGADGVHIGQSDISYENARNLLGDGAIIGISTHNPQQARDACGSGSDYIKPDYIGIGPVFPTPTKKIADPVIGIDGMKEMLAISSAAGVPAVCIGGIDLGNLPQVLEAGARNFCMVRQFTQSDDPQSVLKKVIRICEELI